MDAIDWRDFWNSYRKATVESEDDLFVEVGKTVGGRPISRAHFRLTIERIAARLRLTPNDRLLELCCGNGLVTRALAPVVAEIEAVDFSKHLIAHARAETKSGKLRYFCADVLEHLATLAESPSFLPTKILLGDALAYFEPATFCAMLTQISCLTNGRFLFLATNIPCDELKWNFYNTPERRERFAENQRQAGNTNDGLGRWWSKEELTRAGAALQLGVIFFDEPATPSDYRIDACYSAAPAERL
jgi:SAM-dependent methyltransferase